MAQGIDIVIPVYNEGANIRQALQRIHDEVNIPHQVHIVYDFDEDNTLPVARATASDLGMDVGMIKNIYGRGALNAIKTGLHKTQSEFVIVTMADLSDPPSVINTMYDAATAQNFDLVCGSRYMKGGSQTGGPFLKKTLSKWAGLTLHYFAGIPTHDSTNSFKLYRRKVIETITIESTGGFELGLELVVKAFGLGFNIGEVPTSWTDRSEGESRFRLFHWLPNYLKWYFRAYTSRLALLRKSAL